MKLMQIDSSLSASITSPSETLSNNSGRYTLHKSHIPWMQLLLERCREMRHKYVLGKFPRIVFYFKKYLAISTGYVDAIHTNDVAITASAYIGFMKFIYLFKSYLCHSLVCA